MTTPTSEPLEPRAGDVWKRGEDKFREWRQVIVANEATVKFAEFGYPSPIAVAAHQWNSWAADATRVWPPEQREGDAQSVVEMAETLFGTPPRPSPSPGTVRVRAAVEMNADGQWSVFGAQTWTDERQRDAIRRSGRTLLAFIEADVPLPAAPTVEGRVEMPELPVKQ